VAGGAGCALAVTTVAVGSVLAWAPAYGPSALAAGCGALFLALVWVHGRARSSAQRTEIVRSFADLTILHQGAGVRIDERPLLGEYGTRREAAWAAARCGQWAVIVAAYARYFVLTGEYVPSGRGPVSFRSRAVADVVPALFEQAV